MAKKKSPPPPPTREEQIARHHESLRLCWPQWQGPRVEDSVHGRCSVNGPIVHNLTHDDRRYHYMAPCRIEEISPDGQTIIAVVDYLVTPDSHEGTRSCAELHNGNRLRLDITEVWAPVADLVALRHADEESEHLNSDTPPPAPARVRTLFELMKQKRAAALSATTTIRKLPIFI